MTFKTGNPQIGDIGLVRIGGFSGKLISLAQRAVGSGSFFTHAFVVVEPNGVVQGQPGGAVFTSLDSALNGRRVVYTNFALTDAQRHQIAANAMDMVGNPYSYLDYAAIGLYRLFGWSFAERYVSDTTHMICSQLADEACADAGFPLFPTRLPGDVTPGDIAILIGAK